jgi:hypothetical protein
MIHASGLLLVKVVKLGFHCTFCPNVMIDEAETGVPIIEKVRVKTFSELDPETAAKVAVPL